MDWSQQGKTHLWVGVYCVPGSSGTKCGDTWWQWVQGCMMSLWLMLLRSTTWKALWSLGTLWEWLHELLGSSVIPLGPAASDQARQWWWLEPVVCIQLPAAGACGKAWFSADTHLVVGARVGSKGWRRPWLLVCDYTVSPLQGRTVLEVRPGVCRCTARGINYR